MMTTPQIHETRVRGVRLYEMPCFVDPVRGHLTVGEMPGPLPFLPQRYFITYGVPNGQTRGQHAHRSCAQFLISAHGRCHLHVDDGTERVEICLDRPTLAVLVPPLVWIMEDCHTTDCSVLVLASHPYAPEDYIWDYAEFLSMIHSTAQ